MILKTIALLSCTIATSLAAIPAGQNAYLPPKKGYDYTPPKTTFPTPTRPPTQPPRPPPTPFRPIVTKPPAYIPPRIPGTPSRPPPVTPTRPYPPPVGPTTKPTYVGQPSINNQQHHVEQQHHEHHVHMPGMPFDFNYAVKDDQFGNDYSHNAKSDGDVTKGEYRIQLPDGRTQVVKYTADWKNGFHAQVRYEGTPNYQARPSIPRPTQTQFPGAAPSYPSGPARPAPSFPSGPARPAPSFPSGPARPAPSFPSGPARPAPSFPSGPARPSPGPGYPSGPRPSPSFPSPSPPFRPNQIPGQKYDQTNGGYKY